jgi:hypothetical protein
VHPHGRRLRCDVDRAIDGDPPSLLDTLGEQIGMLQFQRGMRFTVVFQARHEQGDGHRGMLLLLYIARHFGRPQPVSLLNHLLGIGLIGVRHRPLRHRVLDRFGGRGCWTHGPS